MEAYWNFAKKYYKNDPMRSDGHRVSLRSALNLMVNLFGETPVSEFGPLKLTVVRDEMIKPKTILAKRRIVDSATGTSKTEMVRVERLGWTRGYAKAQLMRLKCMFAWGVARELLRSTAMPQDKERCAWRFFLKLFSTDVRPLTQSGEAVASQNLTFLTLPVFPPTVMPSMFLVGWSIPSDLR